MKRKLNFKNYRYTKWMADWYSRLDKKPFEFTECDLTEREEKILDKYKKYAGRSLTLKKKHPHLGKGCIVKSLAQLILVLDSDSVKGNKNNFIKKLFEGSYKINTLELGASGFRTWEDQQFYNILFELDLIDFFIKNRFNITLDSKLSNGVSEFSAKKEDIEIFVEAKKVDVNNFYDIIYDGEQHGISTITSNQEEKILEIIKRNYENAKHKFENFEKDYLICIYMPYSIKKVNDYFKEIRKKWISEPNFMGVVIITIGGAKNQIPNPYPNTNMYEVLDFKKYMDPVNCP